MKSSSNSLSKHWISSIILSFRLNISFNWFFILFPISFVTSSCLFELSPMFWCFPWKSKSRTCNIFGGIKLSANCLNCLFTSFSQINSWALWVFTDKFISSNSHFILSFIIIPILLEIPYGILAFLKPSNCSFNSLIYMNYQLNNQYFGF